MRAVPGVATFLLSESPPVTLSGRIFDLVCPLIDGHRSATQIASLLEDALPSVEVFYAIALMEKQGYLEESGAPGPDGVVAHWATLGVDPDQARNVLGAARVNVRTAGRADAAPLRAALFEAGVTVTREPDTAAMIVVVTDDYRRVELAAAAAGAIEDRPMLPVRLVGTTAWLGPLIVGEGGPCWDCLLRRMRLNDPVGSFVAQHGGETPTPARAALPAAVTAAAAWSATAIATWLVTGSSPLTSEVKSLSARDGDTTAHPVPQDPFCSSCGVPERTSGLAGFEPPQLMSRSYIPTPSGHRTSTAADTLRAYEHLLSPITGVISGMHCISPPGDPLLHAYTASHNWALDLTSLEHVRRSLRAMSGGKGTTDEDARVGAMAEAFERYSGVFRGDEPVRVAPMVAFDVGEAISAADLQLFSDAQIAGRLQHNAATDTYQAVPERFDPKIPTAWSPAWAATSDAIRWVPTGSVYYSFGTSELGRRTGNREAVVADSNGCAAGGSFEEAALQGLLELVERDAIAIWWYNRARRPAVDLDRTPEYVQHVRASLDSKERDFWVLDVTADIGIPVYAAVSALRSPEGTSERILLGFGAHLDPDVALMRAVTELNQFQAAFATVSESHLSIAFEGGAAQWWRTARLEDHPYLLPMSTPPNGPATAAASLTSGDLLTELRTAIALVEKQVPEVLFIDQTRPEVGMPVVRALAPGLRHFWGRYAPGRLYDVPVELGWISQPTRESDLNPVPVFF